MYIQRIYDIVISLVVMIVSAPIVIIGSMAILLEDGAPVLYKSLRVGKNGSTFIFYKLRTMVEGADESGPLVTVENDRRITRVGRILRKYKIDEIANFINVLKGDMSIVGPRPEVPDLVDSYDGWRRQVFCYKPGVTSPASLDYSSEEKELAGSSNPSAKYRKEILDDKLEKDIEYMECNKSVTNDTIIIVKTFLTSIGVIN